MSAGPVIIRRLATNVHTDVCYRSVTTMSLFRLITLFKHDHILGDGGGMLLRNAED